MRRTLSTMRVVLVLLGAVVLVRAGYGQDARQLGGAGITVWTDGNYRGQSATFRSATPDLRSYGLSNNISSLRVARGETWEACEQPNYGGRCQVFTGDQRDLVNTSWNDKISSLRPVRSSSSGGSVVGPRPPIGGGGGPQVVLYSLPGYRGESRVFSGAVPDMRGASFNDRAQSARVIGSWQFCQDVNFSRCRSITGDAPSLAQAGLAGSVSSLRPVGGAAVLPVPNAGRMVLYTQTNFRGQSFALTSPMTQTNTIVAHSAVVTGTWLVCDGSQFTGQCRAISGNVPDLRAVGIGIIQSARPR